MKSMVLLMSEIPIVFLGGLSGAGKSKLAEQLVGRGFLFIDIDPPTPSGERPIDANALGSQWNRFREGNGEPIATELRSRAAMADKKGVLLSFPSDTVFSESRISGAVAAGICVVVLWGPDSLCFEAYRRRRDEEGLPADAGKWKRKNSLALKTYGAPAFDQVRLEVFKPDGSRWPVDELEAHILGRVGLEA